MGFGLIGSMVFWAANFVLLFCRRSSWVKSKYKWYAVAVLFVTGFSLLSTYKSQNYEVYVLFACITTPAFYSLIDYGFERWSYAIHNRDFYLWLRHSADMSSNHIQFKASDRIFSVLLLYVAIGLPALPFLFLKMGKSLF